MEVRNYYNALMFLNKEAELNHKITEELILAVHNLVVGKQLKHKNFFRDGQNVVQDSGTGEFVYMPREANYVRDLINQMIEDFNSEENKDIPIPIKVGILAYEVVTIHPFWDGNGRCTRLLATYILKAYHYD